MTGPETLPQVTVAIPTFRRPAMLRATLESCFAQEDIAAERVDVLVIDNCPARSAEATVREMATTAPMPLRYLHEPQSGISHARNAALSAAGGRFLAFIDDDETASPRWLAQLLAVQAASGAEAVMAPVLSRAPEDAHADAAYFQRFYTCTIDAPTGSRIGTRLLSPPWARQGAIYPRLASGNVLIDRASPRFAQRRFDARLAETGGEDTLYFSQALADGARIVWCAEALVFEAMPAARLCARSLAARAFRGGQVTSWVPMLVAPRRPLMTLLAMATGFAQFIVTAPRWLVAHLVGSTQRLPLLERSAAALGKIFWMAPFRRRAYGVAVVGPARSRRPWLRMPGTARAG